MEDEDEDVLDVGHLPPPPHGECEVPRIAFKKDNLTIYQKDNYYQILMDNN